jgi:hypothetical protein
MKTPSAGMSRGRGFLVFKLCVYGLLLVNTALLVRYATWREVLEQAGWLFILAAFEWESRSPATSRPAVLFELIGYSIAVFCWAAYAEAGEWLNFANASLWLLVVAAIAADLHWHHLYGSRSWRLRNAAKSLLYIGLFAVALTWGLQGEWLDAWDAVLWLLCFFVIELRVFDTEARRLSRPSVPIAG